MDFDTPVHQLLVTDDHLHPRCVALDLMVYLVGPQYFLKKYKFNIYN
jgi:hypothetical protein